MWAEKDRRVAGESCSQDSHQVHAATGLACTGAIDTQQTWGPRSVHWDNGQRPVGFWVTGILDLVFFRQITSKGHFFTQFLFYNWDGIQGLFLLSTLKNKMNGNLPCVGHDYSLKLVLGREGQAKQKKGGWSTKATYYLGVGCKAHIRIFENIIEDSKVNKSNTQV